MNFKASMEYHHMVAERCKIGRFNKPFAINGNSEEDVERENRELKKLMGKARSLTYRVTGLTTA